MQKKFRLKKNHDFQEVIGSKNKVYNQNFVVYVMANELNHVRIGISVSKKIGNAVVRNRIRRQIRAILQKQHFFLINKDLVILTRKKYLATEFSKNEELLNSLLKKVI